MQKTNGSKVMFKFIIASNNEGKIRELGTMLSNFGEVMSQSQAHITLEPNENGNSFKQNALIKAKTIYNTLPQEKKNTFIIADDSGICVDALEGKPGILSARYASPNNKKNASDEENRYKLINELKKHKLAESSARFVACVALVGEGAHGERVEFCAVGECEGKVITQERGKNGFGYDSVFVPKGFDTTLAEVAPEVKNTLSHRRKALEQIKEFLELFEPMIS